MSGTGSSVDTGYGALRTSVAVFPLSRDVVRVSGSDAVSYLQGQCSQDIAGLGVGATADALLLSPQGKVDVFVRITRLGTDEYVVDTDAGFGDKIVARLERFRLRVKVDIERVPWECVAVRGPEADESLVNPGVGEGGTPVLRLPVAWPGLSGFDLLGPPPERGAAVDAWVVASVVRCEDEEWEAVRIEAGIPCNGREVTDATIAAEVGLVDRSVSFTKGCFTGQELVARIDSRGSNVARRLAGLVMGAIAEAGTGDGHGAPGAPPVGAAVFTADGEHEVGQLSSVAWSPGLEATIALATLHRRVVPPETVSVRWESAGVARQAPAQARPLPLVG